MDNKGTDIFEDKLEILRNVKAMMESNDPKEALFLQNKFKFNIVQAMVQEFVMEKLITDYENVDKLMGDKKYLVGAM